MVICTTPIKMKVEPPETQENVESKGGYTIQKIYMGEIKESKQPVKTKACSQQDLNLSLFLVSADIFNFSYPKISRLLNFFGPKQRHLISILKHLKSARYSCFNPPKNRPIIPVFTPQKSADIAAGFCMIFDRFFHIFLCRCEQH